MTTKIKAQGEAIAGAIEVYIGSRLKDCYFELSEGEKGNGIALKYADLEAYVLLRLAELEAKAQERERKAFEAARAFNYERDESGQYDIPQDACFEAFEDFKRENHE